MAGSIWPKVTHSTSHFQLQLFTCLCLCNSISSYSASCFSSSSKQRLLWMNSFPTAWRLSSLSLKQMRRRKAKVVKPSVKAGSMKQMSRPAVKLVEPFDIWKEEASRR